MLGIGWEMVQAKTGSKRTVYVMAQRMRQVVQATT
jgi:hypothetical protein